MRPAPTEGLDAGFLWGAEITIIRAERLLTVVVYPLQILLIVTFFNLFCLENLEICF